MGEWVGESRYHHWFARLLRFQHSIICLLQGMLQTQSLMIQLSDVAAGKVQIPKDCAADVLTHGAAGRLTL